MSNKEDMKLTHDIEYDMDLHRSVLTTIKSFSFKFKNQFKLYLLFQTKNTFCLTTF